MEIILKLFAVIYFEFILLESVTSANILGLMGCASPSHQLWNNVIIDELASRGHNLTILAVDVPKNHPKKVHYLHLEETYVSLFNDSDKIGIHSFLEANNFMKFKIYYDYNLLACRGMLRSKGFQQLWEYPDEYKFDLVLYDIVFGPCLIAFIHKFHYPPIVGLSAFKINPGVVDFVGGHSYPSYIPFFTNTYDIYMNFVERLHNTWFYILDQLFKDFYSLPRTEEMVRKIFPKDLPQLIELQKRTSLVLINTHPAIDYPESLPPNVIEVGGLQIKEPKPLPRNIEIFLNDSSKKGVIYIAMGTNVKSELLGLERQNAIIRVASLMPEYKFLWKFDPHIIKGEIPNNLFIQNWFPQNDVLAHLKVRVFVTHSGSLSIQEATWHSKPMVMIPLIVDQPRNAHRAVSLGMAEKIDFATMNEKDLYNVITKVASNSSYEENAKLRSKLFKDRPMKPLQLAIWWIEYILRHPNPEHLKSPVITLGYLRSNYVDVLIFIGFTIIFVSVLLYMLLKKITFYLMRKIDHNVKIKLKRN